jgi:mRNA interferase MazF
MKCGEIWMIDLNPTRGDEMQKIRPAIVVNDDLVGILALKIIVPITDWKDHYAEVGWMAQLAPNAENGLSKVSAADAFQVRSVSQTRFVRKLGKVSESDFLAIKQAIAFVFDLEVPASEKSD